MEINEQDWLNKLSPEAKAKLTPEVREKLQEAISQMKDNPGLLGMIGTMKGLGKIIKENGGVENIKNLGSVIDVQTSTTTTTTTSNTPTMPTQQNSSEAERLYSGTTSHNQQIEKQRNISPTFNPDVKNDSTRIKLIAVGLLIIIGYLVYKYGFNEQIPQEILDFLKELD